jgi:hypothetical protein
MVETMPLQQRKRSFATAHKEQGSIMEAISHSLSQGGLSTI